MSSSKRTVRSSSLNPSTKTMKTSASENKLALKNSSTLKPVVKKTSVITRKADTSKSLSENKENIKTNLLARVTKLEENFESLKKELQKIVHLESLIQSLLPSIESLQNDMKNVKEDISKVESNSKMVSKNVENFVKSQQSRENTLIFPFKTHHNANTNVSQFTSFQNNKDSVNEIILSTPQKKGNDCSILNRTPKIGDFGISATTLANLPKSSRHKSLSSANVITNLYKMQVSKKMDSQKELTQEEDKSDKVENQNESLNQFLGSVAIRKSIASTRSNELDQEEDDSIFPLMAPVAEEELGPVKFLLGVIDRNRLNSIIHKMNDYIKDQGFDHGNYIKSIKQEDLMNQCRLNEKQAKLIVHILCKLMRLEMKSENEYKILSGTTIRKM